MSDSRQKLDEAIAAAMRTFQVADDELERGADADLEVVRALVEMGRRKCDEALRLLPPV